MPSHQGSPGRGKEHAGKHGASCNSCEFVAITNALFRLRIQTGVVSSLLPPVFVQWTSEAAGVYAYEIKHILHSITQAHVTAFAAGVLVQVRRLQ